VDAGRIPDGAEILATYPPGTFYLFEATGQRKGSGSFYTPRQLAHFVVGETLRPLTDKATPEQILSLRICDPAMGSGGFLVPAVHRLTEAYGEALARAGEDIDHKLDDHERAAYRRLIVERCIYGVDLNPMAVELAKVSLWLATAAAGKPLSFLDPHLRCGNALIGATIEGWDAIPPPLRSTRDADAGRIPDQESLFDLAQPDLTAVIRTRQYLAASPSEDRLQVRAKEHDFARLINGEDFRRLRALGDWWVAPFYRDDFRGNPAVWGEGRRLINSSQPSTEPAMAALFEQVRRQIRDDIRPFHWEIEFPEVFFDAAGARRADAGFDAIIGNPPWEGITFKAAEFYGRFDPSYALLRAKAEKLQRQSELTGRASVAGAREDEDRRLDGVKSFIKNSGLYRMLYAHGTTFNYYRAFLEHDLALLAPGGRLGVIIDSGVASDAATAEHRRELLDHCTIDQFVLCDNNNGIFPIHRSEQFLLLVAGKGGSTDPLPFTSGISRLDHLSDVASRTLPVPRATLTALAPETLAVPDTRDPALLDVLTAVYDDRPLLLQPMTAGGWSIDWGRELDVHDDRKLFAADAHGLPLLEGKNIHQFVDTFAPPTYRLKENIGERALIERMRKRAKKRPGSYRRGKGERWLMILGPRRGVLEIPADHYRPCYREIARASDERTVIAAVVPPGTALTRKLHFFYRSAFDHAADGYRTVLPATAMVYVVGLLNSLVLDFVARRKVSSTVTKAVMSTLPIADVPLDYGPGAQIARLSGRLTCRGPRFAELAEVLGTECGPLSRQEQRALRAELDARVACLYGLSASQLDLILADFRQSADSEGSPVRPDEDYKNLVRREFARLNSAGAERTA